jgi:hypothetical protein
MTRSPFLRPALFAVIVAALAAPACSNSSNGDTINVNGLDCGLIRADMVGPWTVTFSPGVRTLQNCGTPSSNGTNFDVTGGTVNYNVPDAIASPTGAAFTAQADGPNNLPNHNELIVSIEADSCLALVQTWENDDKGWVQCLGTADRVNRLINTVCDSVDLDTNADGLADTACDLNGSLTATVGLP